MELLDFQCPGSSIDTPGSQAGPAGQWTTSGYSWNCRRCRSSVRPCSGNLNREPSGQVSVRLRKLTSGALVPRASQRTCGSGASAGSTYVEPVSTSATDVGEHTSH